RAEVEAHGRIDPLGDALVGPEAARLVVLAVQAALCAPMAGGAEGADQVGDGVLVLADGEAGEFDAGRLVAVAGGLGVEGVEDVGGNLVGVGAGAGAGVVLGHRLGDVAGEAVERLVAGGRVGVELVGAFG